MIMAYIDGKLPDDERREFIKHVRSCKACYEELDIYYTLIEGMKQLDESDNISIDFKDSLKRRLDEDMNRLTTVKRIANSTIMVVIAAIVAGLIWLYSGALDKVYRYEQRSKLNEQTVYYYADFFGNKLLDDSEYNANSLENCLDVETVEAEKIIEFMDKVKKYNETHGGFESK